MRSADSERANAVWVLIAQAISSATNFGGAVLAARQLDLEGFGAFGVAFTIYLLTLGVSRALSIDPLVIRSAASESTVQRAESGRAAASAVGVALIAAGGCGIVGVMIGGQVAEALLALAVVLPFLLVQDVWRFALIMSKRAGAAALNDGVWLIGMVGAFALVEIGANHAAIAVSLWASGAVIAAVVGFAQLGFPRLLGPWTWWREHADLGLRYAAEFLATVGVPYALLLVVAATGGAAESSGIRGAQVLFGPLNVLFLGVVSMALPVQVRRLRRQSTNDLRLPQQVSSVLFLAALFWLFAVIAVPDSTGTGLLGESWQPSRELAPLYAWAMAVTGINSGPLLALRATANARASFRLRMLSSPGALAAGVIGIAIAGPTGAIGAFAAVNTVIAPWWWRVARRSSVRDDQSN